MNAVSPPEASSYKVFISYSHDDEVWANWLFKALETYRVPRDLVGKINRSGIKVPGKLGRCFLDRFELSTAAKLQKTIVYSLENSENLVVVCSPRAVQSRYVAEEIKVFQRLGRSDHIHAFIVSGKPNAADKGEPNRECFPPPLRFSVDAAGEITNNRGSEPLACDAQRGADGRYRAKLKLIAGVLDIDFDRLYQRDVRRRRSQRLIASVLLAASIALLGTMYFQWQQSLMAFQHAESRRLAARSVEATKARNPELGLQLALCALPRARTDASSEPDTSDAADALALATASSLGHLLSIEAQKQVKSLAERGQQAQSVESERPQPILRRFPHAIGARFTSDGKKIFITTSNSATLWDPVSNVSNTIHFDNFDANYHNFMNAVLSFDGTWMLNRYFGGLYLWNFSDVSAPPAKFPYPGEVMLEPENFGFSPDGNIIYAASSTGRAWLWKRDGGELIGDIDAHRRSLNKSLSAFFGAVFTNDSKKFITAWNGDDTTRLWEAPTAKLLGTRLGLAIVYALGRPEYKETPIPIWGPEESFGEIVVQKDSSWPINNYQWSQGAVMLKKLPPQVTNSGSVVEDVALKGRKVVAIKGQLADIWDIDTGQHDMSLSSPEGNFYSADLDLSGALLLTVSTAKERTESYKQEVGQRAGEIINSVVVDESHLLVWPLQAWHDFKSRLYLAHKITEWLSINHSCK